MAIIRNDSTNGSKESKEMIGMSLGACLSDEDFANLMADWNANGGFKTCEWWKWCLDNILVSYGK